VGVAVTRWFAIVVIAGCRIADLDVSGKPCPCPNDYACDTATNTCTHTVAGDANDGQNRGEASIDGVQATSCLHVAPLTTPVYTTTNFSDFGTVWSTRGSGNWTIDVVGNAVQSDAGAMTSVAQQPAPNAVNNYRLVSTFHATSTGVGKAIELAARSMINLAVAPPMQHVYHCNWEPTGGAFMIQRDDSPSVGSTLNIMTVDTTAIPGYTESMPITMEFQVTGNSLACCIDNFPSSAYVAATDTTYTNGGVGMKTYEMTAVYDDFTIYGP
jgi:hypothetical protein